MNNYWMLEVREPKGKSRATIGKQPDLQINWLSGNRIAMNLPTPLIFQLDPRRGDDLTDFFPPAIPLMSIRMMAALGEAGVDNIDSYQATLLDRGGNPIPEEYRAVNIIGRIACADLEASDCEVEDPDDPVGVEFNSLVIDEKRAKGALMFRLHEAANGIVVHDSVRQALEPRELRGIVFVRPEDWIG